MQSVSQKFVRVARWVGLVLIIGGATNAPLAVAAPPQITVSPEPPTGWLSGGEYPINATASSDRDLQSFGWSVQGIAHRTWTNLCIETRTTCAVPNSITYVIRPAELPDGVRVLSFTARHLGARIGNQVPVESTTRSFELRVDHSAPAPPEGLTLIGSEGWRSENRFAVRWKQSPPDGGSPFAGAAYRLCPATNVMGDSTGCVTGERSGSGLDAIDGIAVPATGVWRLQVALKDALGQLDLDAGAAIENLRLDVDAPRLTFVPRDPRDPARVLLAASDRGSGIASVAIEARRRGEEAWRTLSVSSNANRLAALLDDDSLPAGTYEVRGHAVDVVGNERTLALDDSELVQLPVRAGSRLSAGKPRQNRGRGSTLDVRPSVPFGARVPIHGKVTDDFGKGRAHVAVEVSERVALPGVAWLRLVTLKADANGSFTYAAPRGTSRTIRFEYAGTPTTRAAASEVTLRVRAASTLKPSRLTLLNGDTVVLRGRLLGRPVPASGKLVTLQAWTSRGWLTFGNARARSKDGKWSYRYTFTGTTTASRYRFRAVITREESYPYATGASPVKTVIVRP